MRAFWGLYACPAFLLLALSPGGPTALRLLPAGQGTLSSSERHFLHGPARAAVSSLPRRPCVVYRGECIKMGGGPDEVPWSRQGTAHGAVTSLVSLIFTKGGRTLWAAARPSQATLSQGGTS